MPKVRPLTKKERWKKHFYEWIEVQKTITGVTNDQIGIQLGITKQAVSKKNQVGNYDYPELMQVFNILNTSDEDRQKLMSWQA